MFDFVAGMNNYVHYSKGLLVSTVLFSMYRLVRGALGTLHPPHLDFHNIPTSLDKLAAISSK